MPAHTDHIYQRQHHRCGVVAAAQPCASVYAAQQQARRSLISATAASSLMACFLMGAVANLPLAVAPGMGEFSCVFNGHCITAAAKHFK